MVETKTSKTKKPSVGYYEGVGRRSESIARVRAYLAKKNGVKIGDVEHKAGTFLVNGKPVEKVYGVADKATCLKPLALTDSQERFVITVKVVGGGTAGQVGAIVHGLARALAQDPTGGDKTKLRVAGLLTRDSRTRERRMVGTGGKARRLKQSPKR